jgi:hypothetical protein
LFCYFKKEGENIMRIKKKTKIKTKVILYKVIEVKGLIKKEREKEKGEWCNGKSERLNVILI